MDIIVKRGESFNRARKSTRWRQLSSRPRILLSPPFEIFSKVKKEKGQSAVNSKDPVESRLLRFRASVLQPLIITLHYVSLLLSFLFLFALSRVLHLLCSHHRE